MHEVIIFMCQFLNCEVGTVGSGMSAFQGQMAFQQLKFSVSYHRHQKDSVPLSSVMTSPPHVTEMAPERGMWFPDDKLVSTS